MIHTHATGRFVLCGIAALLTNLLAAAEAGAATVTVTVIDEAGKPLPDTVVTLQPADGRSVVATAKLSSAEIDQRDEMFMPYVVIVSRGGGVTFRNSDQTRHHVYSFAPIKQFEFVEAPGDVRTVTFDQPGVAAIGCNIHDQMEAYVFVTEAPFGAVTDSDGKARFSELPAGEFTTEIWHPHLRPNSVPPKRSINLAREDTSIAVTLSVLPSRRRNPDEMY